MTRSGVMTTDRIEINPAILAGKPIIRGTRITVELILRKLSEGATEADLLDAYPRLARADIQAAIRYAADTLAHESCDFAVVRALRAAGHDVVAIAEVTPRAEDDAVIDLAVREERLLLTEDKDFGQLVYARGRRTAGVLLLRFLH